MRRTAALALLAGSLLSAAPAWAARGVNLSWSRCAGEGLGTQLKSFACDTNTGAEQLVVSFVLDAPLAQVGGNEVIIDLVSQDDPVPAWWEFKNAATCRQTSLAMNLVEDPSDVVCADWQSGQSAGGIGSYNSELGIFPPDIETRHRRLKIALAVPATALADLAAGVEYFSCNITIDHAKTAGAGACAGCAGQVCLVVTSLKVTTPVPQDDVTLFGGAPAGSDMAHWQGSGADCRVVPVRNRSWSQVKALYR